MIDQHVFSQRLAERGIRWTQAPLLWNIHEEIRIEGPSDIAAEVHLYQPFRLGAFSHLNGGLIKDVTIGRYCSFARDVQIGHGFHPSNWLSVSPLQYSPGYRDWIDFVNKKAAIPQAIHTTPFDWALHTIIGNDVWLGNHVIIKDGVRVGDGAIVGAHAVVTADLPPYTIAVGNPARVIRSRFSDKIIERLMALQWWNFSMGDMGPLPFNHIEAAIERIEERVGEGMLPYEAQIITGTDLREISGA